MIHVAPKVVGITGRDTEIRLRTDAQAPATDIRVIEWPRHLLQPLPGAEWESRPAPGNSKSGTEHFLPVRALAPGRGLLVLVASGRELRVPVAVFREREFFLCMALSSNHHTGFDPLGYLFGGGPEDLQLEGHAFPKLRQLEAMYHRRGLPITWFIDDRVAADHGASIARWHLQHGDDYAVMPPSFIHFNARDYNESMTVDELAEAMRSLVDSVQACFDFFTTTLAVDQFVGSVGPGFAGAAHRLGLEGLWGVGFDHGTCDTSMFHRGCPWDVYKPDRTNYRIPAGHASRLWMHQWTTRDALLALHSPDDGPSGSVIFSTDPDDVRNSRIMFAQPDYWECFFRGYRANFPPKGSDGPATGLNDCMVFLMHQEDHDCHFPENADCLRRFLDACADLCTPATLEEVNAWLNLSHAPDAHPAQAMLLHDTLTCHDEVVWYAGVQEPADWPTGGTTYPPAIVGYDRDAMWCANEGEPLPWRHFEYAARLPGGEREAYPERDLRRTFSCRRLEVVPGDGTVRLDAEIAGTEACRHVPLVLWHALDAGACSVPERLADGSLRVGDSLVVFVDLIAGGNTLGRTIPLGTASEPD